MEKSFITGSWQGGSSLAGDFDAQFTETFRNIEKTLVQSGCKLADIVTMTVFLIDARYTTRMTELRAKLFALRAASS